MSWYKKILAKFSYSDHRVRYSVVENNDYIILYNIVVDPDSRGQNIGTDFMNALKSYADSVNKAVYLNPESNSTRKTNKLTKWYEGLGFKNKPKTDFTVMEKLKYEPKGEIDGV